MRTMTRIALATGLLALAACYGPPPDAVFVAVRPPVYREELVGVAPGPGYLWIAGYWEWGGAAYRWVPGRWEMRPRPRAVWVTGRWRSNRRGWYWSPGHWR
jgi:WXXGXW repeat (2 copies)